MSAEVWLTVAGVAGFCLVMGFGGLIAWACGLTVNEPEYYQYKARVARRKRRRQYR